MIITLLTDFSTADGYVAEMKGVLYSLAPGVTVVDATHDIPPQDVDLGRLTLARYWRRFPEGSVHVAVVDPDVGSLRPPIAVLAERRFLVGPDNGVLSPALLSPGAQVVTLSVPAGAAPTFHGRDVFAPAAARLANGEPLASIGDPHPKPVVRRTPDPRVRADGTIDGEVIAIDRFGNAITNLVARPAVSVEVSGRTLSLVRTYADVPTGSLCAVAGSTGLIEIAVRNGSGAEVAGLSRGSKVTLLPSR